MSFAFNKKSKKYENVERPTYFFFNTGEKNYFDEINKIINSFDLKNKLVALLKLEFDEKKEFKNYLDNIDSILIEYYKFICADGSKLKSKHCQLSNQDYDEVDLRASADEDIKTVKEIKEAVDNIADFKKSTFTRMYTVTLKKTNATVADAALGGKKRKNKSRKVKKSRRTKRKSLKKRRKTRSKQ